MKRYGMLSLISILFLMAGCGGGASPDPGAAAKIPGIDSVRQEFLEAVNAARAAERPCGSALYGPSPAVTWNEDLAMAAYLHSLDMATNGIFSHTGSDGRSAGDRIAAEGYTWSTYGENIAVGYLSVASVMQAWLQSEGHCRNVMNPAFREIGAGLAEGAYGGSAQAPYWTFDLATPR